jgi:hypothetical protein
VADCGNLPVSGTSVGRITRRICSMLCKSGERPPCIQKIFSSIIAAIGRQLKQSVNVFHSLILYRRLPKKWWGSFVNQDNLKYMLLSRILTFIVETIYTIYAGIFVISTKDKEVLWIFNLVWQQQTYSFKWLFASVNIIAQKQIVCFWWEASIFKKPQ